MSKANVIRLGVIGCGHIATQQVVEWARAGRIDVVVGVEPNTQQFERFADSLTPVPARAETVPALLNEHRDALDAVYIATPHAYHAEQAILALDAGLDVLLEKPMAICLETAKAIEDATKASGRTLVVAFNGSNSPKVRATVDALRSGRFGRILSISGNVSENWAGLYGDHWKQDPQISGGGFLLDSGSHALNTILDLSACGPVTVSAHFKGTKPGVELTAVLSGQMQNDALFALTACGDTAPPCRGEITVFCERAVLRVDPWGQRATMVRETGSETEIELDYGPDRLLIDLFADVLAGRIENPSPVARNIEFARLWAAARLSAAANGKCVNVTEME